MLKSFTVIHARRRSSGWEALDGGNLRPVKVWFPLCCASLSVGLLENTLNNPKLDRADWATGTLVSWLYPWHLSLMDAVRYVIPMHLFTSLWNSYTAFLIAYGKTVPSLWQFDILKSWSASVNALHVCWISCVDGSLVKQASHTRNSRSICWPTISTFFLYKERSICWPTMVSTFFYNKERYALTCTLMRVTFSQITFQRVSRTGQDPLW